MKLENDNQKELLFTSNCPHKKASELPSFAQLIQNHALSKAKAISYNLQLKTKRKSKGPYHVSSSSVSFMLKMIISILVDYQGLRP